MATIKDVARKANVSISVVSKAFNNYSDVSEKTRQRIFEIAKELNYSPNIVAKNLSSKKQKTIAMITSDFFNSDGKDNNNSFDLLSGVYTAVGQNEYELAIYFTDSHKQKQKSYAKFCKERNIGGTVLQGVKNDDVYLKELIDTKIPCVIVDVVLENESSLIGSVSTDNRKASKEMANYLLDRNHRDIIIMAGKKETYVNVERILGVHDAMQEYGLELSSNRIIFAGFSEDEAYKQTLTVLKMSRPTAFLCFSDLMALGVMRAVRETGLIIPDDISVTGFDGLIIGEYVQPPLTTIKQDFFEIGKQSTFYLQKLMEGQQCEKHIFVSHKLVERASVKSLIML